MTNQLELKGNSVLTSKHDVQDATQAIINNKVIFDTVFKYSDK